MASSAPIVLLIDDHADTRDLFAHALSLAGFGVWEAHDGATAVAMAAVIEGLAVKSAPARVVFCCFDDPTAEAYWSALRDAAR